MDPIACVSKGFPLGITTKEKVAKGYLLWACLGCTGVVVFRLSRSGTPSASQTWTTSRSWTTRLFCRTSDLDLRGPPKGVTLCQLRILEASQGCGLPFNPRQAKLLAGDRSPGIHWASALPKAQNETAQAGSRRLRQAIGGRKVLFFTHRSPLTWWLPIPFGQGFQKLRVAEICAQSAGGFPAIRFLSFFSVVQSKSTFSPFGFPILVHI